MGLADYYHRDAVAISQIVAGYDENAIADRLRRVVLAISFSEETSSRPEGRVLLELLIRLTARLYPALRIEATPGAAAIARGLSTLARSINPSIELNPAGVSTLAIAVGRQGPSSAETTIHVGSSGWDALVSTQRSVGVGSSNNPFGAASAACLAAANAFRWVFRSEADPDLDVDLRFPSVDPALKARRDLNGVDLGVQVLVGVGAVGNAAVWALGQTPATGLLHLVDHEDVDLGNLQRYVLASRRDEGASKVRVAARFLRADVRPVVHRMSWKDFAARKGTHWPSVLVALDSAEDRRAVQATLPLWIANAWTQPGDLGLSTHSFVGEGPCLACLYLPAGTAPSRDQIYAEALGIPDQIMQIRELLYRSQGAPRELLELIADRLGVDRGQVATFEGEQLGTIYREGICGGVILAIGSLGSPRPEVHVPVAHQSALAGVLLAARMVARRVTGVADDTQVTRVNVLRATEPSFLRQRAAKDLRGICICQDPDYVARFLEKYATERQPPRIKRKTGARKEA